MGGGAEFENCSREQQGGVIGMLMVAHMGEGGVKNGRKHAHVVYGRPLMSLLF